MMRAYKYRMYPTDTQADALSRQFGATRFVWNWALALIKANNEHIKLIRHSWGGDIQTLNPTDAMTMAVHGCQEPYDPAIHPFRLDATTCSLLLTPASRRKKDKLPDSLKNDPGLKDMHPWLSEVPDKILRYSLRNLGTAFKNFFKPNKTGGHAGYPAFKKKTGNQSAQFQGENVKLDTRTGYLSAPGLKNISVRLHRSLSGKIKTTTLTKTTSGKYFVSFQVDDGQEPPASCPIETTVGIDVGLSSFATTSDGQKFDSLEPLRYSEQRLAVLQRRLSRKTKGSKNAEKARLKIAKIHETISNQRRDFQHKLSKMLVDTYDAIFVESLNIKGMVKNHHLAKSISDAGWSEFLRQLKYKAAWTGKTLIEIGQWEPTSKTCHVCGHKLSDLGLGVREWTCPQCGASLDRDINAAINIRFAGMNQIRTANI